MSAACPHGVTIGIEHGIIFTDTGMCRCCQVSFYLGGMAIYEGDREIENTWEPDDLCGTCGGHFEHFDSAVLDAEVAEKVLGLTVQKRRERCGSSSKDGKAWDPMFRDVWFLENGAPVPAYSVSSKAARPLFLWCKQRGVVVEDWEYPRRACEGNNILASPRFGGA